MKTLSRHKISYSTQLSHSSNVERSSSQAAIQTTAPSTADNWPLSSTSFSRSEVVKNKHSCKAWTGLTGTGSVDKGQMAAQSAFI